MTPSTTSSSRRGRALARISGVAAEAAGRALRMAGRGLPGVAGAALVAFGLWLAWPPLGWIAAGGFLLLVDRRMP